MRLHTALTESQVRQALQRAKDDGHIAQDVDFTSLVPHRSQTHLGAFEVQLGTFDRDSAGRDTVDQYGKAMRVRRYKNSGTSGAAVEWTSGENTYAATYWEWGWFILSVFGDDPAARFGQPKGWHYAGTDDFHEKTGGRFLPGAYRALPPRPPLTS